MTQFERQKMKQAREQRGISQSRLALWTGLSRQAISQFERGDETPSFETAQKIAKTLDCSVEYLYGLPEWEYEEIPDMAIPRLKHEKIGD